VAATPTSRLGETAELKHAFVEVAAGVRLHYVEAGTGPLVVLLHGFPEFWFSWRHQLPALANAGFRVVAVDQRGYNLSDKPRGLDAYRTSVLAQDVARVIERLGVDRASVVGHDWGGGIAWTFAMGYPERLDRLAILNAPHPGTFVRHLGSPRQLRKSWYLFFFQLPWLPEVLLRPTTSRRFVDSCPNLSTSKQCVSQARSPRPSITTARCSAAEHGPFGWLVVGLRRPCW
jgi:pimeloyl-ACP methyl ester carboxylesterase